MNVCFFVIGIIGVVCHQNATPLGDCIEHGGTLYCEAEVADLPAYLSWYDGALCNESPINCFEDTGDYLGDGTPTADSYGWAMACPMGLYGCFFTFEDVGTFQCRDHGSAVTVRYGERYTSDGWWTGWYIVFDLSMQGDDFPHAYDIVDILEVGL